MFDFFKKVDFARYDLVICQICVVTKCNREVENGKKYKRYYWKETSEFRILIRKTSYYCDPTTFETWAPISYKFFGTDLRRGDVFAEAIDDSPIQYTDFGKKYLTQKEKRRRKITIARIKQLEKLLNRR